MESDDEERSEESICNELIETHNIENFQPSTIPWIPSPKLSVAVTHPITVPDQITGLFNLVISSVPRYLSKKYHNVNINELMKDPGKEWNYITLQTMFALHNEAFGLKFMRKINDEVIDYNLMVKQDRARKKRGEITTLYRICMVSVILQSTYGGPSVKPIVPADLCSKSRDFLLEPCVLIQLPWKPAVLQQWLLGAMAEVLMFERESMELRHWLLPVQMTECATRILSTIRDFKSRIVLGFAIQGRMIHMYPDWDPKFPKYIQDEVVNPSISVLNLLISGKAHQIIRNIKAKGRKESDEFIKLSASCYTMDENLEQFHALNFYSIFAWTQTPFTVVFPDPKFNIAVMIKRLKKENITEPCTTERNPLSAEENCLLEIFSKLQKNVSTRTSRQIRVELTIDLIDNYIIKQRMVENLNLNDVIEKIRTHKYTKLGEEITNLSNNCLPVLLLRHSVLHQEVVNCKTVFGKIKDSAVRTVMKLQLSCIEREQKIRLVDIVTEMFDQSFFYLRCLKPNMVFTNTEILEQIALLKTPQNETSVHSQLPKEWQAPVRKNEKCMRYKWRMPSSNSQMIASHFEQRIGRLLYNITKTNFEILEKGGYPFPHLNVIQHILPCLVATFLENEKSKSCFIVFEAQLYALVDSDSDNMNENVEIIQLEKIVKLVHNVITYYENCFLKWSSECDLKSVVPIKDLKSKKEEMDMIDHYKACSLIVLKYREYIRHMLLAHTTDEQDTYTTMLHGFDQIFNYVPNWPLTVSHMLLYKLQSVKRFMICMNAWLDFNFNFVTPFLRICQETFNHPSPGFKFYKNPKLAELHEANVILCELELVFELAVVFKERECSIVKKCQSVLKSNHLLNEHMKIHRAISNVDSENEEVDVGEIVETVTKSFLKIYNTLKEFRNKSGSIFKFMLHEKLPHAEHPLVKKAVFYYMIGNLDALDRMLTVFKISFVKKCRHCSKTEGALTPCEDCVKQNFPDVNYFCSKKCKEARWQLEHKVEHLEFELGLSDYQLQNLSINNPSSSS